MFALLYGVKGILELVKIKLILVKYTNPLDNSLQNYWLNLYERDIFYVLE